MADTPKGIRKTIPLNLLKFDPKNPRFARYFGDQNQPEEEIVDRMIRRENILELMGSISEQGYFDGEQLLVTPDVDGEYVVVEGNRRLSALKILNGDISAKKNKVSIEEVIREAKHRPAEVPCLIFKERRDILRYLGYRHITGAKRWDPLSKAMYVKELRDTFYNEFNIHEQCKLIAKEIGSRSDYVAQILTSLKILNVAQEDDFFGLSGLHNDDIDFGVLTTSISYKGIAEFLGLESRLDVEAKELNKENLKSLLSWMFVQDQLGETILGESRNLRKLAAITAHGGDAIEVLNKEKDIDLAFIHTEGPSQVLKDLLEGALKSIDQAFDIISNVEEIDKDHSFLIGSIDEKTAALAFTVSRRNKGY
jgi:hypothetical protein